MRLWLPPGGGSAGARPANIFVVTSAANRNEKQQIKNYYHANRPGLRMREYAQNQT
jgi:hypothetical protein